MKPWISIAAGAIYALSSAYAENEISSVDEAIPAAVKALGVPSARTFPGGIRMAVSASSDIAQDHVNQGLNCLHGGWEFEASRHFAAAMKEDPECLLAHWGMVMSLLNPSPETGDARNAATDRLLDLIERDKGTELERGYAYGLVKYIEEGPPGAAAAFAKVAEKYPNELQAAVLAALFNRGGYDAVGDPTPAQEAAEKSLSALVAKYPGSPVPLHALLLIRAEAPDLKESVCLAVDLCRLVPDFPPYFHLLGHYQWRSGLHADASTSFGRASTFYQRWMKENHATVADCPEWVKAECYRIVSITSRGDFDTAYAAARQVAAIPLPEKRLSSPGARFMLWDAQTLPARILIRRSLKGNSNEASRSLPKPDAVKNLRAHSLANWWIDGLRFALEARRLIDEGKPDEAAPVVDALTQHGESMASTQPAAISGGERSDWNRAFRALEVLASDTRGRLAMAGPKERRGSAFNWFSAASDRQRPSPYLMPPLILSPMAAELGKYYLSSGKPVEAIEAYERALFAFPNDMTALSGLLEAFKAAGKDHEADEISKKIESLKSQL